MAQVLAELASASSVSQKFRPLRQPVGAVRWEKPSVKGEPGKYSWLWSVVALFGVLTWYSTGSLYLAVLASGLCLLCCRRVFHRELFQVDETGIHWWFGRRGYRFIDRRQIAGWQLDSAALYVRIRSPTGSPDRHRIVVLPLPNDHHLANRLREAFSL